MTPKDLRVLKEADVHVYTFDQRFGKVQDVGEDETSVYFAVDDKIVTYENHQLYPHNPYNPPRDKAPMPRFRSDV